MPSSTGLWTICPHAGPFGCLGAECEEWDEITRKDLDFQADIDVRIRSTTQEMQDAQLKKEARMKTLSDISPNPVEIQSVNVQWLIEEKLRAGGEYDDAEIAVAMDTKNYGSKNEVARAHKAIQEIRENRKAELYYGATSLFLEIIHSYADEHRSALGDKKYVKYMDFIQAHAEIVVENTMRKAREDANNASMGQQAPEVRAFPALPAFRVRPDRPASRRNRPAARSLPPCRQACSRRPRSRSSLTAWVHEDLRAVCGAPGEVPGRHRDDRKRGGRGEEAA